jgi:DNA-binding GntR family transcriptional regulator
MNNNLILSFQTQSKRPRRASLVDIAYEFMIEAIVDRDLEPASRVNIDTLASELEMSNTPIREALARLLTTGLVQQVSNRGFIVSPILTEQEYHHLFDVRCLLEIEALKTAQFGTEILDELSEIAQYILQMNYGTTYKGFVSNLQADESFHLTLLIASGNHFFVNAWKSLNFYPHVSRLHTEEEAFEDNKHTASLAEHIQIVELLREDKHNQAIVLLGKHIRSVEDRLLKPAIKISQNKK